MYFQFESLFVFLFCQVKVRNLYFTDEHAPRRQRYSSTADFDSKTNHQLSNNAPNYTKPHSFIAKNVGLSDKSRTFVVKRLVFSFCEIIVTTDHRSQCRHATPPPIPLSFAGGYMEMSHDNPCWPVLNKARKQSGFIGVSQTNHY